MPVKTWNASSSTARQKQAVRVRRPIGKRLAALAIAAIAGILMYHGERWLLQESAVPDELMVAAYAIAVVDAREPPTYACTREPIH